MEIKRCRPDMFFIPGAGIYFASFSGQSIISASGWRLPKCSIQWGFTLSVGQLGHPKAFNTGRQITTVSGGIIVEEKYIVRSWLNYIVLHQRNKL
jgi:hypothetical protein